MNNNAINGLRESLIQFYKRQEYLIVPVFRFAVTLCLLLLLRTHLGAYGPAGAPLQSTLLNVIIALFCSMLPPGFTAAILALVVMHDAMGVRQETGKQAKVINSILALVMVWDLYRLSLEATALCAVLILLCILIYYRFSPGDSMILLLMPIAYAVNLHYAVPVLAGLLFGPGAAVPVVFGLLFVRYVLLVEELLPVIGPDPGGAALAGERLISNFRALIDGLMNDRGLIILAAALAAAAVVVCFIRHLVMAHAWIAAITAGCILELGILLAGDMRFGTEIDLTMVLAGIVVSFLLAQIARFFLFHADYLRIENVQFEDEDYYYYVKAVPKVVASGPEAEEEDDVFSP